MPWRLNDCGHGSHRYPDLKVVPSISMGYSVKSNDRLRAVHSGSLHFTATAIATTRSTSGSVATTVAIR